MPNVWMNRADGGKHTQAFVEGDYIAIGWLDYEQELGDIRNSDVIGELLRLEDPNSGNQVIGNYTSSIRAFIIGMQPEDHVLTPAKNRRWLWYGRIVDDCFWTDDTGACPYRHRRRVEWEGQPLDRYEFSDELRSKLRQRRTVFKVGGLDEFLEQAGR